MSNIDRLHNERLNLLSQMVQELRGENARLSAELERVRGERDAAMNALSDLAGFPIVLGSSAGIRASAQRMGVPDPLLTAAKVLAVRAAASAHDAADATAGDTPPDATGADLRRWRSF